MYCWSKLNRFVSSSEEETKQIVRQNLANDLFIGDRIFFSGPVGAGKTFIVRSLISFLSKRNVLVTSPTFSLLLSYEITDFKGNQSFNIYHTDLYRLPYNIDEWEEIGLLEILSNFNNIVFLEWSESYLHEKRIQKEIFGDFKQLKRIEIEVDREKSNRRIINYYQMNRLTQTTS